MTEALGERRGSGGRIMAQHGVSLIEFLVVLVIISIGLLSVAGMLAYGIKLDNETVFRTVASAQAKGLADRMHANLVGANAGFYKDGQSTTSTVGCSAGTSATRCAEALRVALEDRTEWNAATTLALPTATYAVTFDATAGLYTIDLGWVENVRTLGGTKDQPTARTVRYNYQTIPEVWVR